MFDDTSSNQAVLDPIGLTVTDVTGMKSFDFEDVDGYRTAGDVATSVAEALDLPIETPYGLRDNTTARMLIDENPIGRQVQQNAELTAIPKAHLG